MANLTVSNYPHTEALFLLPREPGYVSSAMHTFKQTFDSGDVCTHNIITHTTGKWREHPVAVTMYSYMFGALFMGIASLYFVIKKRTSEFFIPQEVSSCANV